MPIYIHVYLYTNTILSYIYFNSLYYNLSKIKNSMNIKHLDNLHNYL